MTPGTFRRIMSRTLFVTYDGNFLTVLRLRKRKMKKFILPLTENHLFSKAYTKGKCEVSKYCAVYVMRNYKKTPDGSIPRTLLGITVNRKLGKACKRNRVKRLIRVAYRNCAEYIKDGYIIVIAARAAAFAPYMKSGDMTRALRSILSKEDFYDIKNTFNKKKK